MASGLYTALRAKHPQSASHSLRVALGCSSWAAILQLDDETRDLLEVAALLHDVGKIGVPEKVLLKPGRLTPEEIGADVSACGRSRWKCSPAAVLRKACSKSFTTAGPGSTARDAIKIAKAHDLPLASRMLSIVDAFDSMTTDQLYRPPALANELSPSCSSSPETSSIPIWFASSKRVFSHDQNLLTEKLARRWLHRLPKEGNVVPWTVVRLNTPAAVELRRRSTLRRRCSKRSSSTTCTTAWCSSTASRTILLWNTGVERLTGVSSAAACGRTLLPHLMDMCNSREQRTDE